MKIVLGVLGLVVLLVIWFLYRASAGDTHTYRAVLAELAAVTQALGHGRDPSEADLLKFASNRRTRRVLYDVLDQENKLGLFPKQFFTWEAMAEADLAFWLNHPNELGAFPDEIELVRRVRAPDAEGYYFVFRFRMSPPHWAAKQGWLAGVAGPYDVSQAPTPHGAGTFSRFEPFDSRTPEQHVEARVGDRS